MHHRFLRCVLLIGLCLVLARPAGADEKRWFKGNTHTHSLWSDGNDFPEMIALWYRDHGYNFLVLSDHDVLSQGERWMKVADVDRRSQGHAIAKAIKRLGEKSVEFRGEGEAREIRLWTLPQVRKLVEKPGFIMIEGEEISDSFERKPIHTNAINVGEVIKPPRGQSLRETMRGAIVAVHEQGERLHRAVLPHLNHPNFHYAITAEDIAHVLEEEFFEVYNGHPGVGHTGDDVHAGVERLWDIASTIRIADLKAPPLYGVATDDSHHYHPGQTVTPGKGWIMVRAEKLDPEALIHAMRHGDFYASSGVRLVDVRYDGKTLGVEVESEGGAEYTIDFIGTLDGFDPAVKPKLNDKGEPVTGEYSADVGKVLKSVRGTTASYELTGKELYVRAVVRSSKPPANPSVKEQVAQAWTQPVGWEKRIDAEKTRLHFHRGHHDHKP